MVDRAVITHGLLRFLGAGGPRHSLEYVKVDNRAIAVVTGPRPPRRYRPLSRPSELFGEARRPERDRIVSGGLAITKQASASDVEEMLSKRVAARVAAGSTWRIQTKPVWRDGDTIHPRSGKETA